jgi:stress response protein YsnF
LYKEAKGKDGTELGIVYEIGNTYIITKKGTISSHRYYIPISKVQDFDGFVLKINITEKEFDTYRETEGIKIKNYGLFKSSDMTQELETTIPIIGQSLEVTKKTVEETVNIIKEPVKKTEKVNIELVHEELVIERIPIDKESKGNNEYKTSNAPKELVITLKREVAKITKQSYIKEEIIVKKSIEKEIKTINEQIINERAIYDENQYRI